MSADTRQLMRRRRAVLDGGDRDLHWRTNEECLAAAILIDSHAYFQREIKRNSCASRWRSLSIAVKNVHSEALNITPDAPNDYYVAVGPQTAATFTLGSPV